MTRGRTGQCSRLCFRKLLRVSEGHVLFLWAPGAERTEVKQGVEPGAHDDPITYQIITFTGPCSVAARQLLSGLVVNLLWGYRDSPPNGAPSGELPRGYGSLCMPPGFTRSCLVGSLVWTGCSSPLRVSTQYSASWPDGSTRLGLEPAVTPTPATLRMTALSTPVAFLSPEETDCSVPILSSRALGRSRGGVPKAAPHDVAIAFSPPHVRLNEWPPGGGAGHHTLHAGTMARAMPQSASLALCLREVR